MFHVKHPFSEHNPAEVTKDSKPPIVCFVMLCINCFT